MKKSISQIKKVIYIIRSLPKVGRKRFLFFYIKLADALLTDNSKQIDEIYEVLSHLSNLRMTKKKYVYLKNKRYE